MASLHERFARRGLAVIGVHSPEFPHEKKPENVRDQVRALGIEYPVVLDNDFAIWEGLGNRYWPTVYLLDKAGVVREILVGETHAGTGEARAFEAAVQRLLEAPAGKS